MRFARKDPRLTQLRDFRCIVCGGFTSAPKRIGVTNPGHIKHIWCVFCRDTVPHIQLGGPWQEIGVEYVPGGEPDSFTVCGFADYADFSVATVSQEGGWA